MFGGQGRLTVDEDGAYENNTTVSITEISADGIVKARFARYFDQLATNLTMDWKSGKITERAGSTIRQAISASAEGKLAELSRSQLANTLGTAVLFFDKALTPIFTVRAQNLSSIPDGGLHATASGVMELPPGTGAGEHRFDVFRWGMEAEIRAELGLEPFQYELIPLAFARELPRGGKPQLFWIAISKISIDQMREHAKNAPESHEFVTDADNMFHDVPEDRTRFRQKFTYEGYFCYELCDIFVKANQEKLQNLISSFA